MNATYGMNTGGEVGKVFGRLGNGVEVVRLLGPSWAFFRAVQAVRGKVGYWEKRTPQREWCGLAPVFCGQLFDVRWSKSCAGAMLERGEDVLEGTFCFFSRHDHQLSFPPDWFLNSFAVSEASKAALGGAHWSRISDFGAGDIKGVWELSRFGWVYPLVGAYAATGEERFAEGFWTLVEDWAVKNPPNTGVHWKCGQEIAMRMFALVFGYFGLKKAEASTAQRAVLLRDIVFESARRIEANIGYALSQKNNHGISEAAGLFTAGVLFGREGWTEKGSTLLEAQALELIYDDGSFSQHSVNYHRVMIHACLWAIQLGRANAIEFSADMMNRVRKAGLWLLTLCDPITGRCPNLGSNDGALIFPVTSCDYLDFRPTIQAVGVVVDGRRWLPDGEWDGLVDFLGGGGEGREARGEREEGRPGEDGRRETGDGRPEGAGRLETGGGRPEPVEGSRGVGDYIRPKPVLLPSLASGLEPQASFTHFPEGGYALFSDSQSKLLFRCPKSFRHRPAQCDLLHVDLFHDGINVLRDGGTFSYNCEQPWQDYFKSVAAHNTIQFDDHDQMPKLSRFLYGKWPKSEVIVDKDALLVQSGFKDWKGCRHERAVQAHEKGFSIIDRISGFTEKAVLRWRLAPELEWTLDGNTCSNQYVNLVISSAQRVNSLRITDGWESLYYQERTPLSVLEVEVGIDCRELTTEILL